MADIGVEQSGRKRPRLAYVANAIGILVFVIYLVVIVGQGGGDVGRIGFIAAFMVAAVFVGIAGTLAFDEQRADAQPLLYASSVAYLAVGILGAMTIGAPLVLAGALQLIATGPRRVAWWRVWVAIAAPLAVLVAGIALT